MKIYIPEKNVGYNCLAMHWSQLIFVKKDPDLRLYLDATMNGLNSNPCKAKIIFRYLKSSIAYILIAVVIIYIPFQKQRLFREGGYGAGELSISTDYVEEYSDYSIQHVMLTMEVTESFEVSSPLLPLGLHLKSIGWYMDRRTFLLQRAQ